MSPGDLITLILRTQHWILASSPALFPLLGLGYSFLTSFHCSLMCSPFLPMAPQRNLYFLFRAMSYSILGGLFGGFGNFLVKSAEYQILSAIAFLLFAVATLSIAGFPLIPKRLRRFKHSIAKNQSGPMRGALAGFIPCHSLFFFYSLAVVSSSVLGGTAILFGHALATMPALNYGMKILAQFGTRFRHGKKVLRILILALCLLNLTYLGSRIFNSEEHAKSKILFCF